MREVIYLKQKEGFGKKLTMEEMLKRTEEAKKKDVIQSKIDEFAHLIDVETDKAVVDVLKELGFDNAEEGMTDEQAEKLHSLMKENGQFINISTETVGNKHVVTVSVIQTVRTLEFDLSE